MSGMSAGAIPSGNNVELRPNMPDEVAKHVDPLQCTWVRVREQGVMFRPLLQYLSRNKAQNSFEIDQAVKGKAKKGEQKLTVSGMVAQDAGMSTQLTPGIGLHQVGWEGETLYVCYERVGQSVGTYQEACFVEEFVIYAKGLRKQEVLHKFCEHVYNEANKNDDDNVYRIYTWEIEERWWKTSAVRQKRPMDSVVLPTETKDLILKDLDNFLEDSTAEWYAKHGICYKRSYLLYGPPGTGKTSFLSAIASKYDRNLCFLQAGHPLLTDSSLHSALNQAPEDSILVMEDIDSLFTVDRKSDSKSPLTFSGILNALDGLASPQGNIFFLTSNHPERLDPAMLRHGRVDVRAEFPAATEAQVAGLFRSFYPDADVEAAVTFSHALKKEWGSMNLAALQDFFIQNRQRVWKEALEQVDAWLKQQNDAQAAVKEFEAKNKQKAADDKHKEEREAAGLNGDDEGGEGAPRGRGAVAPEETVAAVARSGKKGRRRGGNQFLGTLGTVLVGTIIATTLYRVAIDGKHD